MSEHHHHSSEHYGNGFFYELWNSFWNHPEEVCPKCGCKNLVYYDPFFFSPIRTIKGKRRIKCTSCHFIWRPSRKKQSIWEHCKKIVS